MIRIRLILFEQVKYNQLIELSQNKEYTDKLDRVSQAVLPTTCPAESDDKGPRIAYFSMEYGFHNSLKIYSGGLGILAGDYLKGSQRSEGVISPGWDCYTVMAISTR